MTSNDVTPRKQTAVQRLNLPAAHLGQLELALVQATRNTMERSRRYDSEAPLVIRVLISQINRATWATDQACGASAQLRASEREAQQTSQPPSRGWSFFLVEKAAPSPGRRDVRHVIELFLYTEGDNKEIRNEGSLDH
jgi:hypothetical protein